MLHVAYEDVARAGRNTSRLLPPTPIDAVKKNLMLKLENANVGHSFKIRGALNAIIEYGGPLVAASTGNFGNAIAIAGQILDTEVVVVVPKNITPEKLDRIRSHHVEVIVSGGTFGGAERFAHELAIARSIRFVSPYNDPAVIAGGGVIGLEIAEQITTGARIYVPTGGGGLVSGIAIALAGEQRFEVIASCPEQSTAFMFAVLERGIGVPGPSIADGLIGEIEDDCLTVTTARNYGVQFELASEAEIESACVALLRLGWLAEPAAAVGVAVSERMRQHDLLPHVCILTGSNIDYRIVKTLVAGSELK